MSSDCTEARWLDAIIAKYGLIAGASPPNIGGDVQKKILIAERDVDVAEALESRLRARGYLTTWTADAGYALDEFEATRPDLVIISLTLPETDAFNLCRGVRSRPLGALVPILLLGTGSESISDVPGAIAVGADHYFEKPKGLGELLAKVTAYIGPGRDLEATQQGYARPDLESPPSEGVNVAPEWSELDHILRTSLENEALEIPRLDERSSGSETDHSGTSGWHLEGESLAPKPVIAPEGLEIRRDFGQTATIPNPSTEGFVVDPIAPTETIPTVPAESPRDLARGRDTMVVPDDIGIPSLNPANQAHPGLTGEPSVRREHGAALASPVSDRHSAAPSSTRGGAAVEKLQQLSADQQHPELPSEPTVNRNETASLTREPAERLAVTQSVVSHDPPTVETKLTEPSVMQHHSAPAQIAGATNVSSLSGLEIRHQGSPLVDADPRLRIGRPVDLGHRGLGELLMALSSTRVTGRIEVASTGVLRRVFFDLGSPVYADSSLAEEDLLTYLAQEGYVASDALQRARQRALQMGVSAESILIESGELDATRAHAALSGYVIQRLIALFGLERGECVVISGGPRPLDPVDLGQPTARIVLDGIQRKYGRLRLFRAFGTASVVPQSNPRVQLPSDLSLRVDELAILQACDGRRSGVEIAQMTGVQEVEALAILYGLSVVELLLPPKGVTPQMALPVGRALETAAPPRTMDEMPGYGDLVRAQHLRAVEGDYFQVLGVPPGASAAEIRNAYEDLRRRFDPHRVAEQSPLRHQVVEIAGIIEDAWCLLSDERLKSRYIVALSAP